MLLNAILKITFALFIFKTNHQQVLNDQTWIRHLVKYINKDSDVFQAVIIVNDYTEGHDSTLDIIGIIQQHLPSKIISSTNQELAQSLDQNLATSNFFITIQTMEVNLPVNASTEFLIQLLGQQARPKCLIIFIAVKENLSYRAVLEYMWSNYFLDLTILAITEQGIDQKGLYQNNHQNATLHFLNPFNDTYTKRKYQEDIELFSNKLQDLNEFKMKVGSFHYPPYVYVNRNSSGHPLEVSGQDALIAKALSKKMNFLLSEVPSREESYGHWSCDKENETTGLLKMLWHHEIQFITNQAGIISNCEKFSRSSASTGLLKICALVPIPDDENYSLSPPTKWIYLGIVLLTIWIMTGLLKFQNDVWAWFEILRAMLGFTVPREPNRSSERIVFISILIAFSIFASNMFAILTNLKLTNKSEWSIDTVEELIKSNLTPIMQEKYASVLISLNDSLNTALVKKSIISVNDQECIDILLKSRNVTCILRETLGRIAIQKHEDAYDNDVMKIVKERLLVTMRVFKLETKSPYLGKFNEIVARLLEAGLVHHWRNQGLRPPRKLRKWENDEELHSVSVLHPLIFFLTLGCILSIVVFICEILAIYIENRIHACVFFCTQGSVL